MKSLSHTVLSLAVVALIAVLAAQAQANSITLNSVGDDYILQLPTYIDSNFGSSTHISVYQAAVAGQAQRSLLQFDLSGIPAGSTINSATLKLTVTGSGTSGYSTIPVQIYRLTQNWTEMGATWNKYDGTTAWGTPGGDFVGTTGVSMTNPYQTFSVPINTATGTTYSPVVTNLVQEWVSGTHANDGFMLATPFVNAMTVGFATREDTTYGPPQLIVDYSSASTPEPGTLALLGAGLLGLLAYAWRKRR